MALLFLVSSLCAISSVAAGLSSACSACMCQVESGCQPLPCAMDAGSLSCGYYQIKHKYFIDCDMPYYMSWESCSMDPVCSLLCVHRYMNRYGTFCTGGSTPTCEDYARIHNGGPFGCRSTATDHYWNLVSQCLSG